MAIELVAALIVLLVLIVWPGNVAGLRKFGWYQRWLRVLDFAEGGGRVALALVVPVVACAIIAHLLQGLTAAMERGDPPEELDRHLEGVAAIMESHFRYEEAQLLTVLETLALDADPHRVLGPL